MQRNSRPGKGSPKDSDPRSKRSSSASGGRPSSSGRGFSRSTGKDGSPRRSFDKDGDSESRPRRSFEDNKGGERPSRKPYERGGDSERPARRSFDRSSEGERPARKSYERGGDSERPARRSFDRSGDGERPARKPYERGGDSERPARRSFDRSGDGERPARKPYERGGDSERPARRSFDRSGDGERPARKPYERGSDSERPVHRSYDRSGDGERPARKPYERSGDGERAPRKNYERSSDRRSSYDRKPAKKDYPGSKPGPPSPDGSMRLNKFLSNSGICSRREADELILAGAVKVNGVVVTELGTKILPTDKVQYGDEKVRREKLVYVLLNKPKGYITTTDDPYDRNTVMSLVADAGKERIYPVGRLDRNTSGLLLFTTDGELATKLMHPSHKVRKVYHVELDKALTKADMFKIAEGIELEDGFASVDEISYDQDGASKKEVGVELHSGRNRIVRRIFEALGYEVVKLDRMVFAGLTKKDLPRGRWRFLTEKEVNFLKMIK